MTGADNPDPVRVCLCILLNHPFPQNIDLLRKIYAGRFSEIRFLIPFVRSDEADVITVYRGSYCHAAYLTDGAAQLSAIDCDYYLVMQDDVLLNPRISERTMPALFPLGKDDGFIPRVGIVSNEWIWARGCLPKLLYPKSILFGGGIEPETLRDFLPSADALRAKMTENGVGYTTSVEPRFSPDGAGRLPDASQLVLHGYNAAPLAGSAEQDGVKDASDLAYRSLLSAMTQDQRLRAGVGASEEEEETPLELPLPLIQSAYTTDFYILPKSGFDDFSHYVGVAAAANLFVEIMAPTILQACCKRVLMDHQLDLDFTGMDSSKTLTWFLQDNAIAIHPFKLSLFKSEADRAGLLESLRVIAEGRDLGPESFLAQAAFGRWLRGFVGYGRGWHAAEHWGVWSSAREAVLPVALSKPGPVRLMLLSPCDVESEGSLHFNTSDQVDLRIGPGLAATEVILDDVHPSSDGWARIVLKTDALVQPTQRDPESDDARLLGIGVSRIVAL